MLNYLRYRLSFFNDKLDVNIYHHQISIVIKRFCLYLNMRLIPKINIVSHCSFNPYIRKLIELTNVLCRKVDSISFIPKHHVTCYCFKYISIQFFLPITCFTICNQSLCNLKALKHTKPKN